MMNEEPQDQNQPFWVPPGANKEYTDTEEQDESFPDSASRHGDHPSSQVWTQSRKSPCDTAVTEPELGGSPERDDEEHAVSCGQCSSGQGPRPLAQVRGQTQYQSLQDFPEGQLESRLQAHQLRLRDVKFEQSTIRGMKASPGPVFDADDPKLRGLERSGSPFYTRNPTDSEVVVCHPVIGPGEFLEPGLYKRSLVELHIDSLLRFFPRPRHAFARKDRPPYSYRRERRPQRFL